MDAGFDRVQAQSGAAASTKQRIAGHSSAFGHPGGQDCPADGIALRIETVINAPGDLGCNRMLANLPELQAKARAINDRLLHTETAGQARHL